MDSADQLALRYRHVAICLGDNHRLSPSIHQFAPQPLERAVAISAQPPGTRDNLRNIHSDANGQCAGGSELPVKTKAISNKYPTKHDGLGYVVRKCHTAERPENTQDAARRGSGASAGGRRVCGKSSSSAPIGRITKWLEILRFASSTPVVFRLQTATIRPESLDAPEPLLITSASRLRKVATPIGQISPSSAITPRI